ncbi:hypothetical protein ACHAWF_005268 [Thalassiosira exigua]
MILGGHVYGTRENWVVMHGTIYDVKDLIYRHPVTLPQKCMDNQEPSVGGEEVSLEHNPTAHLTPTLNKVIMNSLGEDTTDLYEALFGSSEMPASFFLFFLEPSLIVPCYNKGDNELYTTIKSVLNTTYPGKNKVLFMVANGLITGNGESMSTLEHLANRSWASTYKFEDNNFEYDCIGVTHIKNRMWVYHGILQKGHNFLK